MRQPNNLLYQDNDNYEDPVGLFDSKPLVPHSKPILQNNYLSSKATSNKTNSTHSIVPMNKSHSNPGNAHAQQKHTVSSFKIAEKPASQKVTKSSVSSVTNISTPSTFSQVSGANSQQKNK